MSNPASTCGNLKSVGTMGTVGTASKNRAYGCSRRIERTGNGWEHNSTCMRKSVECSCQGLALFPLEIKAGTDSQSGACAVTGCSCVPTVPRFSESGIAPNRETIRHSACLFSIPLLLPRPNSRNGIDDLCRPLRSATGFFCGRVDDPVACSYLRLHFRSNCGCVKDTCISR